MGVINHSESLLSLAYEPGDGSAVGAQLVDGEWWHPVFGCDSLQDVVDNARAAIERLQAQQTPVPVSERLPGPKDLCSKLKFCWWWNCMLDSWAFCDASYCDHSIYTHWLSANALPLCPRGEWSHD